jgi:hypothetical protein
MSSRIRTRPPEHLSRGGSCPTGRATGQPCASISDAFMGEFTHIRGHDAIARSAKAGARQTRRGTPRRAGDERGRGRKKKVASTWWPWHLPAGAVRRAWPTVGAGRSPERASFRHFPSDPARKRAVGLRRRPTRDTRVLLRPRPCAAPRTLTLPKAVAVCNAPADDGAHRASDRRASLARHAFFISRRALLVRSVLRAAPRRLPCFAQSRNV